MRGDGQQVALGEGQGVRDQPTGAGRDRGEWRGAAETVGAAMAVVMRYSPSAMGMACSAAFRRALRPALAVVGVFGVLVALLGLVRCPVSERNTSSRLGSRKVERRWADPSAWSSDRRAGHGRACGPSSTVTSTRVPLTSAACGARGVEEVAGAPGVVDGGQTDLEDGGPEVGLELDVGRALGDDLPVVEDGQACWPGGRPPRGTGW